jgi:hypothetical protein
MGGIKETILLLGKLPPPYMGPSIATELLLKSELSSNFNLLHIDTKVNADLKNIGKLSFGKIKKNFSIYKNLITVNRKDKPQLAIIPFSQTTIGFIKDSIYIHICLLLKTKVLLHLRGSEFKIWMDRSNVLTRWYVKSTLNKCEGVIVLGNNLKYLFEGYLPTNKIANTIGSKLGSVGSSVGKYAGKKLGTQTQSKLKQTIGKRVKVIKIPKLPDPSSINNKINNTIGNI